MCAGQRRVRRKLPRHTEVSSKVTIQLHMLGLGFHTFGGKAAGGRMSYACDKHPSLPAQQCLWSALTVYTMTVATQAQIADSESQVSAAHKAAAAAQTEAQVARDVLAAAHRDRKEEMAALRQQHEAAAEQVSLHWSCHQLAVFVAISSVAPSIF